MSPYRAYKQPNIHGKELTPEEEAEEEKTIRKRDLQTTESVMSGFQFEGEEHAAPSVALPPRLNRECSVCNIGIVRKKFTKWGYLMAIFMFPIGIYCCYVSRVEVCDNCGTVFED